MIGKKLITGFVLAFLLASSGTAAPGKAPKGGFTGMYLLGDSLSDQGNLFYATEYLTGVGLPDAEHYFEGRFGNGEIWAGVLAGRMGIALEPSLFRDGTFDLTCLADDTGCGTNYAYGGARTDYHRIEDDATKPVPVAFLGQGGLLPEDAFPWTLDGQRNAFDSRNVFDPDGLYVVLSGANDLADLINMVALCQAGIEFGIPEYEIFCTQRGNPSITIPVMAGAINNSIAAFAAAGATDILVPNLPNLGVVPAITMSNSQELIGLATLLSSQYNQALERVLVQWDGLVNIIRLDTFTLLTDLVSNPGTEGFTNVTDPCYDGFVVPGSGSQECTEPDSYLFWDIEHPTAAFNAYLAEEVVYAISLDILDDLAEQLVDNELRPGLRRKLMGYLDEAMSLLTDDNPDNDTQAIDLVEDFKETVNRKEGKQIPQQTADLLSDRADKLKSVLRAI
jgi:phospholipase/lecithinase/hemolysin